MAGSFALNYDETDTQAGISTGASVDAGAGDVTVSAANTTEATVEAKSKAESGDTGAGVSVGINIAGNNATRALVDGTLSGGADVTLSATGSHKVDTLAQGGGKAADGTGVGGALALTVAMNNDTEASLGAGAGLTIGGDFSATADHHGVASTLADGQASGSDAAVGVAIALSFVDDSASARADRDITAGGAVSLAALADGASEAKATASSAGTDKTKEESGGNKSADDQAKSATGVAKQQSGDSTLSVGKSASTDDGDAGTSEDGAVSVGAALGLNVAWSSAEASVGAVQIISGGALELKAENNMDASAVGDGSATTNKDGTAVGIGIAINVGFMDNQRAGR